MSQTCSLLRAAGANLGLHRPWVGQVFQVRTLLPTSTTLTISLQEPIGSDQIFSVERQALRTISVSSTSFGCPWGGEGVLGNVSQRNVMCMYIKLLDFARKLYCVLDRLEDRNGLSKISLNVEFHDDYGFSGRIKYECTGGDSCRTLVS